MDIAQNPEAKTPVFEQTNEVLQAQNPKAKIPISEQTDQGLQVQNPEAKIPISEQTDQGLQVQNPEAKSPSAQEKQISKEAQGCKPALYDHTLNRMSPCKDLEAGVAGARKILDALRMSPSEMQKTLLRPGTVDFAELVSNMQKLHVQASPENTPEERQAASKPADHAQPSQALPQAKAALPPTPQPAEVFPASKPSCPTAHPAAC